MCGWFHDVGIYKNRDLRCYSVASERELSWSRVSRRLSWFTLLRDDLYCICIYCVNMKPKVYQVCTSACFIQGHWIWRLANAMLKGELSS